jgi:hypothetical protein
MGVVLGLSGCSPQKVHDDNFTIHFKSESGTGIAIGRPGDVIIAAADGTVDFIASSADSEWITIYHGRDDDGLHMRTGYSYHRAVLVKEGDPVIRGQAIGIVGGRKRQYLQFAVAKAPENLYGVSSAWIKEDLHDYWIGDPGKISCFKPGKSYSQKSSKKLTWPLECRSVESLTVADSNMKHPKLISARHQRMFQDYLDNFEGSQGFKVFVMSNLGTSSWLSRATYENALKDAMTSCAGATNVAGCRLFAVGDTIVWDMTRDKQEKVIAEYKATKTPTSFDTTASLGSSSLLGFQNYELVTDDHRFKVFIFSESGNWSWRTRLTYEEALKDATDSCGQRARRGLCRLFAVGNTVVWDMSEKERDAVIEAYRTKNKN